MGISERKEIIKKIEKIRGSKVITYFISHRFDSVMIDPLDLRIFYEHLKSISKSEDKIDLFMYSLGGVGTVAWALVNLLREFSKEFNVLIPFNAFSCATSISLGANEIVMGKNAYLGPVDPTVGNDFNPIIDGKRVGISVVDIAGFLDLVKDKFEIRDQQNLGDIFKILSTDIKPLALGNAYRHYLKARDDTKKILLKHLDPIKDKEKISSISDVLIEKLYFHGHHINRNEAKELGLNVVFAEEKKDKDTDLNKLMWELYEDYEKEVKLFEPYEDVLPTESTTNKIPIKFIETTDLSKKQIIEQKFEDLGFPDDSVLVQVPTQFGLHNGVLTPNNQQILINAKGQPIKLQNKIYDKIEKVVWE